ESLAFEAVRIGALDERVTNFARSPDLGTDHAAFRGFESLRLHRGFRAASDGFFKRFGGVIDFDRQHANAFSLRAKELHALFFFSGRGSISFGEQDADEALLPERGANAA